MKAQDFYRKDWKEQKEKFIFKGFVCNQTKFEITQKTKEEWKKTLKKKSSHPLTAIFPR